MLPRLRRRLVERGLVVSSEQPAHQGWIARYLATALRERTAETLAQVLGAMQTQGMIREWLVERSLEELLEELDSAT